MMEHDSVGMVYVLNFKHFTLSLLKTVVIRAGNSKNLVRIVNREDPDLGLLCLSRPFWQARSVQKF